MNIIVFRAIDFPRGAAATAQVRLFIRGFRANGVKACFVSTSNFSRLTKPGSFAGRANGCPYFHIRVGTSQFGCIVQTWISSCAFLRLLIQRKKKQRGDVLFYANSAPLHDFPLLIGCFFFRIPVIGAVAELPTALWERRRDLGETINYVNARIAEIWIPRLAYGMIAITHRLASFYRGSAKEVLISPIMVDPDESLSTGADEECYRGRKVAVYSGTFEEKDGVPCLLEAFRLVVNECPEAILVMTGMAMRKGGETIMQEVKQQIELLGLQEHVEMAGFIPKADLNRLNSRADVLLVCRTNSRFANYGLPWKLGEYAVQGRPIVATDVSDVHLYFSDGVDLYLASPENAGSISERIMTVFNEPQRSLEIGASAKKSALEKLSYITETKRIIEFIQEVVPALHPGSYQRCSSKENE